MLGCLNPAYLISRKHGFDIRAKGTGNAGASNTTIVLGWKFGAAVAVFDIAKGAAAVLLARLLFPGLPEAGLLAGNLCVLGHIFPFYLRFKGGKGLASYIGMAVAFDWKIGLALIAVAAAVTLFTDYIALATLTVTIAFPVYLWLSRHPLLPLAILGTVAVVVFCKHISNLRRIKTGEETGLRAAFSRKKT